MAYRALIHPGQVCGKQCLGEGGPRFKPLAKDISLLYPSLSSQMAPGQYCRLHQDRFFLQPFQFTNHIIDVMQSELLAAFYHYTLHTIISATDSIAKQTII